MAFAIDDLSSVIAHWSADAITGLSDGDPVDALPDSISGWDLTASTTERPLYRPTSSINSLPAIEFDGTDDWMITGSTKSIGGAVGFCSVVYFDVYKNYHPFLQLATNAGKAVFNSSQTSLFSYAQVDRRTLFHSYTTSNMYVQSPRLGFVTTTPYLITMIWSAGMVVIRINGRHGLSANSINSEQFSVDVPTRSVYGSFGANASTGAFLDGLQAETVLFNESLLCESKYIEGVLAHKYGITLGDTNHPFYAAAPTSGPGGGGTPTTFHPLKSRALGPNK